MKTVLKVAGIIAVVIILAWLFGQKTEHWQGIVYPNGCDDKSQACLDARIGSPDYPSEKRCVEWGLRALEARQNKKDTFVCAMNCTPTGDGKGQICEAILKGNQTVSVE